ncbi:MAG: LPS export ABC transporter periplasmic protein LptC [bacterium]|nr:LPS export ABC transporter periplasmic protein LptC [bacterium]MCP5070727.1 LPS export ABC transporter periplasmic protein LptC [bacterium]
MSAKNWGKRLARAPREPISAPIWAVVATGLLVLLGGFPAAAEDSRALDLAGMTYVSSHGAINEMVLDAEKANIKPDEDLALLEQVHVVLASLVGGPRGRGGLDMTCDSGTVFLDSGDFVAEGDVRGTTGDGRRFRTTWLRYDHEEGLVMTDVPVSIRDRAGTYRGGGFRYWVRENRFELSGGASVVAQ